jgi:hypothetical protein
MVAVQRISQQDRRKFHQLERRHRRRTAPKPYRPKSLQARPQRADDKYLRHPMLPQLDFSISGSTQVFSKKGSLGPEKRNRTSIARFCRKLPSPMPNQSLPRGEHDKLLSVATLCGRLVDFHSELKAGEYVRLRGPQRHRLASIVWPCSGSLQATRRSAPHPAESLCLLGRLYDGAVGLQRGLAALVATWTRCPSLKRDRGRQDLSCWHRDGHEPVRR